MAFNAKVQDNIEDDSLLPVLWSEAESDFQTLFAAGPNQADSSHELDPIFSHSILSTVLTDPENGCSYPDTLSHSTLAFESSHRPKLGCKPPSFPRDVADILEQWLAKHSENPYPTKHEKASLARKTGLAVAQVSSWFVNARRRYKHGGFGNTPSEPEPIQSLLESQLISREEWPLMSPLDRWENSPPEIEPAPLEAIMNAVGRSENDGLYKRSCDPASSTASNGNGGISTTSNDTYSILPSNKPRSVVSSSSNSSAHSIASSISQGSFGCFYLDESPRRRRRRRQKANKSTTAHKRIFQCTFCTDTFRTKHDWTRHEKTLHLSLESFTCAPFGSVYNSPTDGIDHCVFCDEPCPTKTHTETHRFMSCQQKPPGFRTFYRKDHLVQHLRLLHGVKQAIPVTETWKSQVEHINSRCGFCEQKFTVWSERNNHIAGHFRDGALMKNWQGCRGLDPPVALAVENAMPPYLIGVESAGMNPFSASQIIDNVENLSSTAADACQNPTTRQNPTPFEYLTASLTTFVQQLNTAGHVVTDEMLQKEARRIVFCDDDPWNQTPADNAEWLKLFKEGVGLEQGTEIQTEIPQSPANQDYSEFNFCLPWSADHWTPTGSHPTTDLLDITSASMAWAWQSPECLAEFRRNLQALSADPSSGLSPDSEP